MSVFRKVLIVPPVLAGAVLLALAMAGREGAERAAPGETATPVGVIAVQPRSVLPRVAGFGTVQPARVWTLVPQVAGRIAEIHPELTRGGTVAAGDLLVRIAPETYEAALAEAEARIAEAEAQRAEIEVSERTIRASLEIERKALALAEEELDRQRRLAERGTIADATADAQERSTLQQRARVQDLENQLTALPARLSAVAAQTRVAEASRTRARLDLERTEIRAPFDARLASAEAEIDQYVGTTGAIAVLDGLATAEIEAEIAPARMAPFVRLAADGRFDTGRADFATVAAGLELTAQVRLAGNPVSHEWPARVARISDGIVPETRSVGVIVAIDDPYGEIRPGRRPPLIKGMFARVELRARPVEGRMVVPRAAVRAGRVMVADAEDRLAFRDVEVVQSTGEMAVLGPGLAPGTRVVVSDPTPAVAGMLLDPQPDEAAARRLARDARPDLADSAKTAPAGAAPGGSEPGGTGGGPAPAGKPDAPAGETGARDSAPATGTDRAGGAADSAPRRAGTQ